jgi:hypothetical protein
VHKHGAFLFAFALAILKTVPLPVNLHNLTVAQFREIGLHSHFFLAAALPQFSHMNFGFFTMSL